MFCYKVCMFYVLSPPGLSKFSKFYFPIIMVIIFLAVNVQRDGMKRFTKKVYEFSMISRKSFCLTTKRYNQIGNSMEEKSFTYALVRVSISPVFIAHLLYQWNRRSNFFHPSSTTFQRKTKKRYKSIWLDHHHHG